jgi:hypothetical protein
MYRRFLGSALVGVALFACGDQPQEQNPIIPGFATNSTNLCAPNVFNGLIAGYFSQSRLQTAMNYKDAMLANLPGNPELARTNGFNLMREIAAASKEGATGFDNGSNLTRETLKCIFDVTDTNIVKGFATLSFVDPLKRAAGGGYDVRAGAGDLDDPVFALDPATPTTYLSGVALPPPPGSYTWAGVASERILIYGFPGAPLTSTSYDWSAIPRRATFTPGVVVGLCVPDGTKSMIQQAGQFVLAFQEASYFLDPDFDGACSASLASVTNPSGFFALGQRVRNWGRAAFGVTALQASMVSPGLTGGNAGSLRSLFDDKIIEGDVILEYVDQPQDAFVNQPIPPPVTVKATSTQGPMIGVPVTLLLVNNNGKKVTPSNNVATTKIELINGQPVAIARFTGMSTNKSGGYATVIQDTQVPGRPGIPVKIPVPVSQKFNVKPLK